jgi:nucleoid DNA-binding protein
MDIENDGTYRRLEHEIRDLQNQCFNKMTKAELADKLYLYHGYSARDSKPIVDQILKTIKVLLAKGHAVEIEGLGVLKVRSRRPYRRINKNLNRATSSLRTRGKNPVSSSRKYRLAWMIHDFAGGKRKGALKD